MGEEGFSRIESERLILRRFVDSDLEPFLAYRNDPEVARYQSWESVAEREAISMIEGLRSEEPGTPGEWFQFAVEAKETGLLIGDCAMRVYAITDQENESSFTLLEQLGLRREGSFVRNAWFKGRWSSEYLYAVLQDEWLGKQRS